MPRIAHLALLLSVFVLAACAAQEKSLVPTEPVVAAPGDAPDLLTSSVSHPPDEDLNDWPDLFSVFVYLWKRDSTQPQAFDGTFEFKVTDLSGNLLQNWVIGPDQAPQALDIRGGLTGYSFTLEMPLPEPGNSFPDRVFVESHFFPQGGPVPRPSRVHIHFRVR